MKKIYSYVILSFLVLFISISGVNAEALATCTYSISPQGYNESFNFVITYNEDGTVSTSHKGGDTVYTRSDYIQMPGGLTDDFKSAIYTNNKVAAACPPIQVCFEEFQVALGYNSRDCSNGGNSVAFNGSLKKKAEAPQAENQYKEYCIKRSSLRNANYDVNIKFYRAASGENRFEVRNLKTNESASGKKGASISLGGYIYTVNSADEAKYWSDNCGGASLFLETPAGGSTVKIQSTKPEESNDGQVGVNNSEKNQGATDSTDDATQDSSKYGEPDQGDASNVGYDDASCPLGEDVTKDLSGVLKIFRIAAPLLCIAFTVLDAIQTIAKEDGDAGLKKVGQKFIKRLAYTILVFFMAVIVDAVMQLINVWDAEGQCTFEAIPTVKHENKIAGEAINIGADINCTSKGGTWNSTTNTCDGVEKKNCSSYNGAPFSDSARIACETNGCSYTMQSGSCS